MQVELDLPESLIRKMKALNILLGENSNAPSFENFIIDKLEESVTEAIYQAVDSGKRPTVMRPAPQDERKSYYHDASEIAEGLGDFDEEEPEPVKDEMELIPSKSKGGVTPQDLDHDMDIDDPEHEAKAEAIPATPSQKAEEIFANVTGLPIPAEDDMEEDPRITKRKKKVKLRARVVPATDGNMHGEY